MEEYLVRRITTLLFVSLLTLGLTVGCKKQEAAKPADTTKPGTTQPAPAAMEGKVLETMNAGGYTYVQIDTGKEKVWAAAPEFKVKVGDAVSLPPSAMPMEKYESKSLKRTFDLVFFVDSVAVNGVGQAPQAPNVAPVEGHPQVAVQPDQKISGVKKADKTVGEVFAEKASLAGKSVTVRGKVVKFSPEIMGKNWIHLQDGTGATGSNDLTITTSGMAKQGDTVVVTGVIAADKDFGYGYKYAVIIEDAKVTVE